ncbi:MAG: ABC transporter permease [Microbacteriaceae bacterium]|nr:MAG: ABC transporter permease [Microbacteriaceae bacterium]
MTLEMGAITSSILFVFLAGLQSATPLVLAAVGGAFSSQVNVFNLALEGMMISGAFAGFAVSNVTGNALLGLLAGAIGGMLVSAIFAIATVYFKTDEIVVGIVINLVMLALTGVLLSTLFNASGQFVSTTAGTLPKFWNTFDVLMPVALFAVLWAHWFLYRTRTGLRMRAVGGNPAATTAAGVSVTGYRYRALLIGGLLAGLGGAYLPLSGLSMFTVGMTAGAGFIAVSAVLFGEGKPLIVGLAALIFGIMGAAAIPIQQLKLPSEYALILPYLVTIIAVSLKGIRDARRRGTEVAM